MLVFGAEMLVRQAARIAQNLGIAPVVVGLTVVAFGTSAPELAIGVQSTLAGSGDIAIGNVVGSNIANVLLILGISAIITPMLVSQHLIRIDVPIMIGISLLFYWMSLDGAITRLEGGFLALLLVIDLLFVLQQSRRSSYLVTREYEEGLAQTGTEVRGGIYTRLIILIGGLVIMVMGARFLVASASDIARSLGVSELVIGLTIVAIGTSAPELATSIIASLRGQRDIAVGNVVGSNIFNILFVLGITAVVSPTALVVAPAALAFDIPFMVAVAVACLPVFFAGSAVRRPEGLLFLAYYIAYTIYLYMAAASLDALPQFSRVMLVYVVPLTVLGIGLAVAAELRRRRRVAATSPQTH
jgi:cation:H+ antiporter